MNDNAIVESLAQEMNLAIDFVKKNFTNLVAEYLGWHATMYTIWIVIFGFFLLVDFILFCIYVKNRERINFDLEYAMFIIMVGLSIICVPGIIYNIYEFIKITYYPNIYLIDMLLNSGN